MKKAFKIFAIVILLLIIGFIALIAFDSRDYFKAYFETKSLKLKLADEKHIDSLLFEIKTTQAKLDSVISSNNEQKSLIDAKTSNENQLRTQVEYLQQSNANLQKALIEATK